MMCRVLFALMLALAIPANVCMADQDSAQSRDDERAVAYERPERPSEPSAESVWYGLPLVFIDSYTLMAMGAGNLANNEALTLAGLYSGCLNGMWLHLGNNPMVPVSWLGLGKAVLSATLRLGFGALACGVGPGCGEMTNAATWRIAMGIGAGMLVDWLLLTYKRVEPERRSHAGALTPWAAPHSLGVGYSREF
jgi:hypothetical protein